MLPCWLEWTVGITTLVANVVTIGGIITALIKLVDWHKNSIDEKRINLTEELQEPTLRFGFDRRIIASKLKISNETNKDFYIESITLIQNGERYKLEFRTDLSMYFDKIHILPYEDKEINGYFIMPPYPHHLAKTGAIKLSTNIKPLNYKIDLPKDNTH